MNPTSMMSTTRILGGLATLILASSIGVVQSACSSADTEVSSTSKETIAAANVAITIQDENGTRIGEGTGLVIAPQLVLTSAHLVAGNASWTVRTANGKTIKGVRGLTYDWMVYNSNKSHPRKHDVAVIYLAEAVQLPAYPEFATTKLASGSKGTRIRGTGGTTFQEVRTTLETIRSFPNSYITDMPASETLDTGGVVLNDKNQIVGVVTGKGMTTGKLYVARTDALVSWLSPKRVCAGAAVGIRTYGTPPPGGSSGTTTSSSSSGSTSGSTGSDGTPGSSGSNNLPPGSGPGTGTGTGNGPNCGPGGDGGGNCSGACGSSGSNGTPSDGSSGSSGGGDGSSPGSSGGGTSGTSGNNTIPPQGGTDNPNGGGGGSGSNATSGSNGNTAPGAGGAGSGSAAGDAEVCTGESDNPEVCPPESNGCSGSGCGGGQPDEFIIYGGTSSGDGTNPDVH